MINSNVPPNRVDKKSDQIESIATNGLVFNESLCVGLELSDSRESTQKLR